MTLLHIYFYIYLFKYSDKYFHGGQSRRFEMVAFVRSETINNTLGREKFDLSKKNSDVHV